MPNDGIQIGETLVLWNVTTNSSTGNTKPDTPGDPDYIPPGENLTACPLPTDLTCPVIRVANSEIGGTVVYEFSVPRSVLNNPSLAKVIVGIYVTGGDFDDSVQTDEYVDFSDNYIRGNFAGLTAGTDYSIGVRYEDDVDADIKTCNDIVSITPPTTSGAVSISSSQAGASIDNVENITGFVFDTGDPVTPGNGQSGTHSAFTAVQIKITITGTLTVNPGNISINKNGIPVWHLTLTNLSGSPYLSVPLSYTSSDDLSISLNIGA